MEFSVIIPLFKGKKYINRILNYFKKIKKFDFEIIFVNDFPEEKVDYDFPKVENCKVKLINNERNSGIHYSRVQGLRIARNEYILLLDQDDSISENFFDSQFKKISEYKADVVVSNGFFFKNKKGKSKLYANKIDLNKIRYISFYFLYGNQIASPGQCLIKKSAIPFEWLQSTLKINGADDWLLWTMMLARKRKFIINNELLYVHNSLEYNTSDDEIKMIESSRSALRLFRKLDFQVSNYWIGAYERKLCIRKLSFEGGIIGKVVGYMKNPDILVCLLYIKILRLL